MIKNSGARGAVKDKLIDRLEGNYICPKKSPVCKSIAAKEREVYRDYWICEKMPDKIENVGRCVEAILYMSDGEIREHQKYICSVMNKLYFKFYPNVEANVASNIRKAICRIDESVYLDN